MGVLWCIILATKGTAGNKGYTHNFSCYSFSLNTGVSRWPQKTSRLPRIGSQIAGVDANGWHRKTFYTAFKKATGLSPSEFRNNVWM